MAEEHEKMSRRTALKVIAAGLAAGVPGLLDQDALLAQGQPSDEEKNLPRIPLTRDQGLRLLEYKVNKQVWNQEKVINTLKDKGLWPHEWKLYLPVMVAKKAAETFYNNILDQYSQNNAWDEHKNEALTVGSLSRRLFEHSSNHFNEGDLEFQLSLRKKYPKGPPYPQDVQDKIKLENSILGEETVKRIRDYSDVNFGTLNPKDAKSFAMVTRHRPQLDFSYIFKQLNISQDLLKVSRSDLEAIGMNVTAELAKLPPAPWSKRVGDEKNNGTPPTPKF